MKNREQRIRPGPTPFEYDQRRLLVTVAVRIFQQCGSTTARVDAGRASKHLCLSEIVGIDHGASNADSVVNALRKSVGVAGREHDRPLVRRHRTGVTVECRDRFAHHS